MSLGRFLRKEPILARPVSRPEKVWRWCRRKPALAAAVGMVILVATLGVGGILWQLRRTEEQRGAAIQAQSRAEHESYDAAISEAQVLIEQNRFDRAREILSHEEQASDRGWEWGWLQRLCNLDLMTLTHESPLLCASFSPDGRYLVTGGVDAIARLWALATGREVRQLRGHGGWLVSAEFSPDGKRLVTASTEGMARVWDTATAQQILKLEAGDQAMEAAFSPDAKTIATAGRLAGLKLWNAQDGALLPERGDYDLAVWSVSFSPDGRRLAYAGGPPVFDEDADSRVVVLDRSTGEQTSFVAHHQQIRRVRFSPDGRLLATASLDGTARLWNAETGQEVRPLLMSFGGEVMQDAGFSPDGQWLAVAGSGWEVPRTRILEVASGRLVRSLKGHSTSVPCIKFSPDGTRLATASYDATARLWSATELPEFISLEGHDLPPWTIAFSADGKRVATGGLDLTARVWDAETGDPLVTLNVGFPVISLAFNPEGDRLVTVATNHTAKVWNSTNGQALLTLSGHTATVMAVAWSMDGRWILTGSKDGSARLWEASTGVPIRLVRAHTNWVLSVAFSPESRRFVTGGHGQKARIWETETGRLLRELAGDGDYVQQVAFSPDGRRVATGGSDRKAHLWDADSGGLLFTFEGHRNGISSLAFSPDGARLATAGGGAALDAMWVRESAILLWDLHTGQRLLKLDPHSTWAIAVAFSPDGRRLATGSGDNTVRIREAFPWKSEDYAGDPNRPLGEKVEDFKRRYWQAQLGSPDEAKPPGTRLARRGRRWQSVTISEVNLPAERGAKRQPTLPFPLREPEAGTNLIDLTASYNASLTEAWLPCLGLVDVDLSLSSLPAGLTNLAGVSFDLRGLIRLGRSAYSYAMFPTNVEIAVRRTFRRLHVLHGTDFRAQEGRQIGTYRLHYRDGSTADLPILYGHDLRGAFASEDRQEQAAAAELAWTGNADPTKPAPTPVRLYRRTYENPAPDHEVVRISFESTMTSAAPFLVALTVEP